MSDVAWVAQLEATGVPPTGALSLSDDRVDARQSNLFTIVNELLAKE
jgi:hypothetical protein